MANAKNKTAYWRVCSCVVGGLALLWYCVYLFQYLRLPTQKQKLVYLGAAYQNINSPSESEMFLTDSSRVTIRISSELRAAMSLRVVPQRFKGDLFWVTKIEPNPHILGCDTIPVLALITGAEDPNMIYIMIPDGTIRALVGETVENKLVDLKKRHIILRVPIKALCQEAPHGDDDINLEFESLYPVKE